MSVLWRIAADTPGYAADDLSGIGAKITGGRWNSKGVPVVYCSTSIALATLETVHYLRAGTLPFNRFLVRIEVPEAVWQARQLLDPVPGGWDAIPASMSASRAGDGWCAAGRTALLVVPSVIVPDECNVLINPRHPDAAAITASTVRRWQYDPRFFA
ncbi:RES family NAD+ phosphorylase [Janthinobacterium sp. PSPC3-1]|uniref:RES family NAD+ phosphorylase n=1 Tax=Janthinobacterium sp. PSPC3-1 TaxID=2804653 RepID=UPI003CF35C19